MSSNTKDIHQEIRKAKKRGWIISMCQNNHWKWQWPESGDFFFTAATPQDFRAIKNIRSNYRKIERNHPLPVIKKEKKEMLQVAHRTQGNVSEKQVFQSTVIFNGKNARISMPRQFGGKRMSAVVVDNTLIIALDDEGSLVHDATYGAFFQMGKRVFMGIQPFRFKREITMQDGEIRIKLPNAAPVTERKDDAVPYSSKSRREIAMEAVKFLSDFCETDGFTPVIESGKLRLERVDVIS